MTVGAAERLSLGAWSRNRRASCEATIEASGAAGIWALQAAISPENPASIALHEKYEFRMVDFLREDRQDRARPLCRQLAGRCDYGAARHDRRN